MITKSHYIDFTKMHGSGNDFIIIDNRDQNLSKEKIIRLAPKLCHRHFGIGADGIITLQPPVRDTVDYTMFYRNADGSDAGMCGNGARCLALFAHNAGLESPLSFNVHDTVYRAEVSKKKQIRLAFPVEPAVKEIEINGDSVYKIFTGTQHIVLCQSSGKMNNKELLSERGQKLRNNEAFAPTGTNVNFIHGISKNAIELCTYEKGVEALTLACGTGAVAAALAWHQIQKKSAPQKHSVIVQTEGGTLQVGFSFNPEEQKYSDITLSGQAEFVFQGQYEI